MIERLTIPSRRRAGIDSGGLTFSRLTYNGLVIDIDTAAATGTIIIDSYFAGNESSAGSAGSFRLRSFLESAYQAPSTCRVVFA